MCRAYRLPSSDRDFDAETIPIGTGTISSRLVASGSYEWFWSPTDRLEQLTPDATARTLLEFDGREVHLPRASELRPRAEFLRRKIELAA